MSKHKGITMKKILLINSILSLGITFLAANATLDEMYKEMREIAKSELEVKKSITTTSEVKVVELKAEIAKIKANIEELKAKKKAQIEAKAKVEVVETKTPIAVIEPKVTTKSEVQPAINRVSSPVAVVPSIAKVPQVFSTSNIVITLPLLPQVPTVVNVKSVNGDSIEHHNRSIKFSKRVPPNYTGPKFGKEMVAPIETKEVNVGEVKAGQVSAYLRGELLDLEEVEKRLHDSGFNVLSSVKLDKKGDLISVVFTNQVLISMSSKTGKGFASTLRILINKKEKSISITNPLYLLKAFLQDDFDKASAHKLLAALSSKFGKLENSDDKLKFQLLPKYQFMNGLPFYKDTIVVASGDKLLEKIKDNKRVFFEQKLDNGSVIVGIKLNKRTNGFLKKIGSKNAAMLPLLVLIEDGKATMLDPKYYISIMYPQLTMEEFMKIATVPDSMVKDSKRVFR